MRVMWAARARLRLHTLRCRRLGWLGSFRDVVTSVLADAECREFEVYCAARLPCGPGGATCLAIRRSFACTCPSPPAGPGSETDFSYLRLSRRRAQCARPPVDVAPARHRRPRLHADPRARRRRPRRRALGARRSTPSCCARGLRAMMKTRVFDARMLIAQRQKKISFYMQCLGEEAIAHRPCAGAASPATCASRPTASRACCWRATTCRWSSMMCQLLSQRARPAEGPPAAGDVLVQARRLLLDLGQPRHAVHPGGRLGAWPRRSRATRGSPRPGSATAPPPRPTSTPR